jgi:hypothetical protein
MLRQYVRNIGRKRRWGNRGRVAKCGGCSPNSSSREEKEERLGD